MMNPDMMKAAQNMMSKMSPEDMKRMSEFAANMDPNVMQNMMKNMGGAGMPNMDPRMMQEQLKNMSPEQLRQGMSQAQSQMGAQKQHMFNASTMLKNEGNAFIKSEKYADALQAYNKALDNLKAFDGSDIEQLQLSLLLNAALCHLKHKDWSKTVETCDEALKISPKAFKAFFRRGLARFELGQLQDAVTDISLASKLSPEDKTISADLERVTKDSKARGLSDKDLKEAEKKAQSLLAAGAAAADRPSQSSGSSSMLPGSPGWEPPNMEQAMEQLTKNPDMLSQATEAMKNMSPEDMERMLKSSPMPPGMDTETLKRQMETLKQNPDMLKNAVNTLKAVPEDQRRQMLATAKGNAAGLGAGAPGAPGAPNLGDMSKFLENPDMMKEMAAMAAKSGVGSPEESEMMQRTVEMMSSNPELGKQMSDMLKNIPPEQLEKMMSMSSAMRSGQGAGGGPDLSSMNTDAMASMMNDPGMMKAAEEMMKNISPETLASMAKAQGIDISDDQVKMMGRMMPLIPWVMKAMRVWGYVKKPLQSVFSSRGRIILAVLVVLIAVIQHNYW